MICWPSRVYEFEFYRIMEFHQGLKNANILNKSKKSWKP